MENLLENSWVVAISGYQTPSRYGVSVEPAVDMIRRNLGALRECRDPGAYTVVGLFDNEADAREFGRLVQKMRNDRADIQDLLTRRPEED